MPEIGWCLQKSVSCFLTLPRFASLFIFTVMPQEEPLLFNNPKPIAPTAAKQEQPPALQSGWQAEKQYYTIGEVAQLFGLRASNIRFWTTEFKLKVRTNRKGDRLYTGKHIQTLRAIYYLVKEKGYTLSGAKAKLQETKNQLPATAAKAQAPVTATGITEGARPIIYSLELQQSLLQLRNRLIQLRNQLH